MSALPAGRATEPADPRDPLGLAADAPMLAAWLDFTRRADAGELLPMSVPGHKQRQDLVGAVIAGDAPFYGGIDTIKHADGMRVDCESRAARLWGADWCRFSVAGSTHGNQALALAAGQPGREVIINRTLHRSLLLGLVLAGLRPVWVRPEIDPVSGLPAGSRCRRCAAALAAHPDACAVFLGDPTYVGTISDLSGHAATAHAAGVPLIVDAAWAAHLGFHPDLPPHAITAGADAMVTSAHKALPAYTQGALVLARTERLDPAVLDRAFEATHTTSPTGSIMASIDAARALLAADGEQLCGRLIRASPPPASGCGRCRASTYWTGPASSRPSSWCCWPGPARTATRSRPRSSRPGCRWRWRTGTPSFPSRRLPTTRQQIAAFTEVLIGAIERHRSEPRKLTTAASWTVEPETVLAPREAFFAPNADG